MHLVYHVARNGVVFMLYIRYVFWMRYIHMVPNEKA